MSSRRSRPSVDRSEFAGFRFPPDVIAVAVRWYLPYGLSYRDVEELLAERGIVVDHVTVYRWVQRFTPLFIDAARPCRHSAGDRWFVDETYVKIAGRWRYLYRAVDQFGQVIDIYLSAQRYARAARRFFSSAMSVTQAEPVEVVTDRAYAYVRVIEDLIPPAWHHVERYANNPIECDHGRLKAWLRPMRGLKRQLRSGGCRRPRIRAEPPPRSLRTRRRGTPASARCRRVRRARPRHLSRLEVECSRHGLVLLNATEPSVQIALRQPSGDRPSFISARCGDDVVEVG